MARKAPAPASFLVLGPSIPNLRSLGRFCSCKSLRIDELSKRGFVAMHKWLFIIASQLATYKAKKIFCVMVEAQFTIGGLHRSFLLVPQPHIRCAQFNHYNLKSWLWERSYIRFSWLPYCSPIDRLELHKLSPYLLHVDALTAYSI